MSEMASPSAWGTRRITDGRGRSQEWALLRRAWRWEWEWEGPVVVPVTMSEVLLLPSDKNAWRLAMLLPYGQGEHCRCHLTVPT